MILYSAGEDIQKGDMVTIRQDGMVYRALCSAVTTIDSDLYGKIIIQCTLPRGHDGWHSRSTGRHRSHWPNDKIVLPVYDDDDDD